LLVVDTSAIVTLLLEDPPVPALADRLSGRAVHAPHLLDVEFLHALRRLVANGRVPEARASVVRADFAGLHVIRYPHRLLLDRMWDLRHNLSAYDATFVALSEVLDVPLVTTDARLASSSGHTATIEAY
jgi:predicted nucleic acid-binding protein